MIATASPGSMVSDTPRTASMVGVPMHEPVDLDADGSAVGPRPPRQVRRGRSGRGRGGVRRVARHRDSPQPGSYRRLVEGTREIDPGRPGEADERRRCEPHDPLGRGERRTGDCASTSARVEHDATVHPVEHFGSCSVHRIAGHRLDSSSSSAPTTARPVRIELGGRFVRTSRPCAP